jgi:hypothetical protein
MLNADKAIDMLIDFGVLKVAPLSKMVSGLLIQKRKILHTLSSAPISKRVKQAAKPVFDLRKLKMLIDSLGTKMSGLQPNTALTDRQRTEISQILNAIRLELPNITPAVQQADDTQTPALWRKNLDYGERKQATIRGDNLRGCPFGLPIPRACHSVGAAIHQMTPLEGTDDKDKYTKSNKLVFAYCKEGKQCPYADKVLDDKFGKVDCDFGDTGQGKHSINLQGSPFYPQPFQSIGLNGIYSKPLGWYGDPSEARNLFFGLLSYVGRADNDELVKIAQDIGLVLKALNDKHGG